MCFELDNNGDEDLKTWHEIQEKLMPNSKKSNHLVVHHLSIMDGLLTIGKENTNIKVSSNNINAQKEPVMLKLYTLLASLTRRVYMAPYQPEDKNLTFSVINLLKNLKDLFPTHNTAEQLTYDATMKRVKPHITADIINKHINKTMVNYFK